MPFSFFVIVSLLLLGPIHLRAQTSQDGVATDSTRLISPVVASIIPAITLGGAVYENYADFWRNANRVPFYFSNDPPYAMHNDKLGHAFFTAMTGDVIALAYRNAGLNDTTSAWLGGGFAFLTEFVVEIEDGFRGGSDAFGFSPGDLAADIIGGSLPILKVYSPFIRKLSYKTSLWPSVPLKAGAYGSILGDDESHFYWMSYDVHDDLHTIGWPKWLNFTVGYGVEHLDNVYLPVGWSNGERSAQLYLGLDLNPKGFPIEGKAWEIIAEIISHYKIPFPALQVMPRVKWWWLK
ncbi:MAG: DUF2279 domain-containing protein [Candidatus Kapaibacterium sp.]